MLMDTKRLQRGLNEKIIQESKVPIMLMHDVDRCKEQSSVRWLKFILHPLGSSSYLAAPHKVAGCTVSLHGGECKRCFNQ